MGAGFSILSAELKAVIDLARLSDTIYQMPLGRRILVRLNVLDASVLR